MQTNPFEPPSELADTGAPVAVSSEWRGKKVYVPNHVGLAAFLGSPMAGAWLIGANYAALERYGERTKALAGGFVATVVLFVVAAALPEGFPGTPIALAYTFGLRELARRLQGKDIEHVLVSGGAKHSAWRAAGIGVVCLVLFVSVFTVVYLMSTDVERAS